MWTALFITLACACAITIVVLIFRSGSRVASDLDMDLDAYKTQLRDIEQHIASGTMTQAEGDLYRRDVHRRILAAGRRHDAASAQRDIPRSMRLVAATLTVLLLVPGTGLLLVVSGYQHLPDMPVADRLEQARTIRAGRPGQTEYIAALGLLHAAPEKGLSGGQAATLTDAWNDAEALEEAASEQARLGHYHAAVIFQNRMMEMLDSEIPAGHHVDMAAYLVAEAGGYVSPEAETHLATALMHDHDNIQARYLSGLLDIQTGRPDLGYWQWVGILEDLQPDDPIGDQIREALPFASYAAGIEHLANRQPGGTTQ